MQLTTTLLSFNGDIARGFPGALGVLAVLTWPHVRRIELAVAIQFAGAIAFGTYFARGGSSTAAACCAISAAQLLVAGTVRDRMLVRLLFAESAVLLVLFAVCTWNGTPSALAMMGGLFGTLARMQSSTARMKAVFLAAAPLWLAHNVTTGSVFGLAVDVISVASNVVGLRAKARSTYRSLQERLFSQASAADAFDQSSIGRAVQQRS